MSGRAHAKGRIASRLLVAVVLFSSIITLVITGTQLFLDYRNDVGEIRHNLALVESTYVPSLANSVWVADDRQIMTLLEGLLALPDVRHVSLSVAGAGSYDVGAAEVEKALTETYVLRRDHRGEDLVIGTLVVSASVQEVIDRLVDRAVIILIGNGVKTFLVAGFILLIFYLLVTRHLSALSQYARGLSLGDKVKPLELPRRKQQVADELDELSASISDLATRVQSAYRLAQESEQRFRDFTYAMRVGDGTIKHFQTSGRPCWDGDGHFLGYRGIARDITAAFQAHEARQRTELQLARAIEAIPGACALFDEDDGLIICNNTYRSLFEKVGRKVETGTTFGDLTRTYAASGGIPGTQDEVDAWAARRLNRRQRPERNFEYLRSDGHWAEVSDYVLDDGRVLHFAADVTARKNAEARAQAERVKATEYLQVAQTIIVALNRAGRVELLNRYGCEVLGYRLEEVLGKDWFELVFPPDLLEPSRAFFDAVIAGERRLDEYEEHDIVTKQDGLRRIAWRNTAIMDDTNAITTTLSSGLDITEHLAAEEALLQAQKMDAIGKLTGGIAHDFNNLLAIILGNLDLIHERLPKGSDLTRLVRPATTAAERGAELTARLLAFSRKQPLKPKTVNLNQLLGDMTELLRRSLGETISVGVKTDEDVWPCEVDPVQMQSVVLNLAVNARDAMPKGGRLTIETANRHLDQDDTAANPEILPGDYVHLAVSDNGTGMSADVLERVFEPFFTTKRMGEGTGLGLSITYGFVKQSGGAHQDRQRTRQGQHHQHLSPARQ